MKTTPELCSGDLIRLIKPPDSIVDTHHVCLWGGPDDGAKVVERIPIHTILMVIADVRYYYSGNILDDRTQLLVISPRGRLGYVMSDCVELL